MEYGDHLIRSAEQAGNIVCMGLDPIAQALPSRVMISTRARPRVFRPLCHDEARGLSVAAFAQPRLLAG